MHLTASVWCRTLIGGAGRPVRLAKRWASRTLGASAGASPGLTAGYSSCVMKLRRCTPCATDQRHVRGLAVGSARKSPVFQYCGWLNRLERVSIGAAARLRCSLRTKETNIDQASSDVADFDLPEQRPENGYFALRWQSMGLCPLSRCLFLLRPNSTRCSRTPLGLCGDAFACSLVVRSDTKPPLLPQRRGSTLLASRE